MSEAPRRDKAAVLWTDARAVARRPAAVGQGVIHPRQRCQILMRPPRWARMRPPPGGRTQQNFVISPKFCKGGNPACQGPQTNLSKPLTSNTNPSLPNTLPRISRVKSGSEFSLRASPQAARKSTLERSGTAPFDSAASGTPSIRIVTPPP